MGGTVDMMAAIDAAVRAPSMHNSQPWRFRLHDHTVEMRLDPARRLPATDPSGWAARVSGGAALFNLRLALSVQGWRTAVAVTPDRSDPDLLALLTLDGQGPPTAAQRRLAAAIWHRRSHREQFWPDPVPADARTRLVAAAQAEGGWLELLIGAGPAGAVAQLAHAADEQLMRRPAYRDELAAWARREGRPGREAGDGVSPQAAGPVPHSYDLLPARPYHPGPPAAGHRDPGTYPMVGVLGTVGDTPGDQVMAGQVLQRVLLSATDDQLATAMVSQPIEVPAIREQLRLALRQPGSPQMLLQIGYGVPGALTARRPARELVEVVTVNGAAPAPDQPLPVAQCAGAQVRDHGYPGQR